MCENLDNQKAMQYYIIGNEKFFHDFVQRISTKQSFLFVHSKSEYTIESVSMYGRPAVNTITLQRLIRLWWNFVHRTVLLISRSSSKMRTMGSHLPELYQKMWLFLWAYSMEFLPKKTQVSLNRPKGILYFRAWKVVFVVKKSAIIIVPLGRYRSYSFSWKFWKFVKNKKICKFCGLDFFLLYGQKSIPNIYSCSSWARAVAHMLLLILNFYKKSFQRNPLRD
jgi:hypothetical protein